MSGLALHPLCELFPPLADAEFNALRDDIAANGQRSPIVLLDGQILDGANRYRACLAAGVEPIVEQFAGGDVLAFVMSANLHRRHLSAGQQAAIVAAAQDWTTAHTHGGDRRPEQGATLHLDRVADRAATAGASVRTQKMADKVVRADPGLAKQVARGEVSLPKAVEQITQRETRSAAAPAHRPPRRPAARDAEAAQAADDAYGDFDPLAELDKSQAEIAQLRAEVAAAEADNLQAEVLKWHRIAKNAERMQGEAMDRARRAQDREGRTSRQLKRCGEAVGETDPDRIVDAVRKFVRQHQEDAA